VHFGGIGKWYRGLYGCRGTCLRHRCGKNRGCVVADGGRAAAAPNERSPEKELQVQPVGSACVRRKAPSHLSHFNRFDTRHIPGGLFCTVVCFYKSTFVFFSATRRSLFLSQKRSIPPPCLGFSRYTFSPFRPTSSTLSLFYISFTAVLPLLEAFFFFLKSILAHSPTKSHAHRSASARVCVSVRRSVRE